MIFIANARGEIQGDLAPYAVNQGSDNANQIVFVAPIPQNATVMVKFMLPNGIVTLPYCLKNAEVSQVQGIFDDKGQAYRCWMADIDYPITEIFGTVTAQFLVYFATNSKNAPTKRATSSTTFEVIAGIPVEPKDPDSTEWGRLLDQLDSALALTEGNVNGAVSIASSADQKATEAVGTANDAKKQADSAKTVAEEADRKASEALANANSVIEVVNAAKEAAEEAKGSASLVDEVAGKLYEAKKAAEDTIEAAEKVVPFIEDFNLANGEGDASVVLKNASTLNNPTEPNKATGQNASAFGDGTLAEGKRSFTEGYKTKALSSQTHAEGQETVAEGTYSHAEGRETKTKGSSSHAEGYGTLAKGPQSHAEGEHTVADGSSSHAEGTSSTASGIASHAEGKITIATGDNAHAEGVKTQAKQASSHAEGGYTAADGLYAHAEGYYTTATGQDAHAEGSHTKANGAHSHAEGQETEANGYAHAEGYRSKALGSQSHAEGLETQAIGQGSHSEGHGTEAKNAFSHVEGKYTRSSREGQHVEGLYNAESLTAYHIIGDGTSETDRHNLYEVGKDSTGRYIKLGSKKVYESEFNDTSELEANIAAAASAANEAKDLARQAYDGSFAAFNLENGEGKGSVVSKGSVPNTVSADNAFAFGNNNRVEAAGAYAGGSNNTISAEATSSFVHGENLTANRPSQVVFGKSNEQSEYANFIVAVGDENIRRNLFEVGERHGSSYLRLGSQIITAADISRVFTLRQKTKIVDSLVIDFSNGDTVLVGNMQGYINTKSTLGYDYETGMITFSVDEGLATVANNAIDCYKAFDTWSKYLSNICIALNPTLVNNVIVEWVASYNEYRAPVFYQCQNTSTASAYSGRLYLDNLIQTYFEVK